MMFGSSGCSTSGSSVDRKYLRVEQRQRTVPHLRLLPRSRGGFLKSDVVIFAYVSRSFSQAGTFENPSFRLIDLIISVHLNETITIKAENLQILDDLTNQLIVMNRGLFTFGSRNMKTEYKELSPKVSQAISAIHDAFLWRPIDKQIGYAVLWLQDQRGLITRIGRILYFDSAEDPIAERIGFLYEGHPIISTIVRYAVQIQALGRYHKSIAAALFDVVEHVVVSEGPQRIWAILTREFMKPYENKIIQLGYEIYAHFGVNIFERHPGLFPHDFDPTLQSVFERGDIFNYMLRIPSPNRVIKYLTSGEVNVDTLVQAIKTTSYNIDYFLGNRMSVGAFDYPQTSLWEKFRNSQSVLAQFPDVPLCEFLVGPRILCSREVALPPPMLLHGGILPFLDPKNEPEWRLISEASNLFEIAVLRQGVVIKKINVT